MIPFFTYLKAHCAILSYSSLVMLVVFNSVQASRPRPQFHIPTFSIEQKNPKKKVLIRRSQIDNKSSINSDR